MLLSAIQAFFNGNTKLYDFKKEIETEIIEYKKNLSKKGGSSPIILNEDLNSLLINKKNVIFLCEAFLNGNLNEWELNYIAEALLLSERIIITDNSVNEALLSITDPEYFKSVNHKYIEEVLNNLAR